MERRGVMLFGFLGSGRRQFKGPIEGQTLNRLNPLKLESGMFYLVFSQNMGTST